MHVAVVLVFGLCVMCPVCAQLDGSFWWQNQNLRDIVQKGSPEQVTVNTGKRGGRADDDRTTSTNRPQLCGGGGSGSVGSGSSCHDSLLTAFGSVPIPENSENIESNDIYSLTNSNKVNAGRLESDHPDREGRCGERGILLKQLFVNENSAKWETGFGEFPWMVAVLKWNDTTQRFDYRCGGALVTPQAVITAAHCLSDTRNPSSYLVKVGKWDLHSKRELLAHQERNISILVRHPQYYAGGLYNDIAILGWKSPVDLSEPHVATICLPTAEEQFQNQYCVATGWGKAFYKNFTETSEVLKAIEQRVVASASCERKLQATRLGRRFRLHKSFLCAEGLVAGEDTCYGDGGSPLVCDSGDNNYVLTGLVSWGIDCGSKTPAVYTDIRQFLDWIDDKLQEYFLL